jgi:hypothetical protein
MLTDESFNHWKGKGSMMRDWCRLSRELFAGLYLISAANTLACIRYLEIAIAKCDNLVSEVRFRNVVV